MDSELHISVLFATLLRVATSEVPFHWSKSLALVVPITYRSMEIHNYINEHTYLYEYKNTYIIHIYTNFFIPRVYIHMAYALPCGRLLNTTVYQYRKIHAGVSIHARVLHILQI